MIQAPRNATLAEALYRDIDKNEYLQEIYGDLLYNYSIKLFCTDRRPRDIPVKDALRFADLLSKSSYTPTADRDRIWGQEIAILLRLLYPEDFYEDEIKIRFISAFAQFFQNKDMVIETCRMLIEELTDTLAIDAKMERLTMELNDLGVQIREHIQKNMTYSLVLGTKEERL